MPPALTPQQTVSPTELTTVLQQVGVGKQTTISPTINIPITVTGDWKVGESVKNQVEPRLENVIRQMVDLSRSEFVSRVSCNELRSAKG